MDAGLLILTVVIAILLQGLFLIVVIRSAMRIKRQLWNQKHLLNLLIEISKKLEATGKIDIDYVSTRNNNNSDQYLV